jgi:hypothetical protein
MVALSFDRRSTSLPIPARRSGHEQNAHCRQNELLAINAHKH